MSLVGSRAARKTFPVFASSPGSPLLLSWETAGGCLTEKLVSQVNKNQTVVLKEFVIA